MRDRIPDEVAKKIMLAANLRPLEKYKNIITPWKSKCLVCKKIVYIEFQRVKYENRKCPECGKLRSKNSKLHLAEFAFQSMVNSGWMPLSTYSGKNNKTPWLSECLKCGEKSTPTLGNVLASRGSCGYCKGNKIKISTALKIMDAAGLNPLNKYPGAGKPWKSKCQKCLNLVYPRFADVKNGIRCEYCSGTKADVKVIKRNMAKAKLKPLINFPGSAIPWKSLCLKCRKIVMPRYNGIASGSGGCIYCMKRGIKYDEPALVYLISHSTYQSIKIGITGMKSKKFRLSRHQKLGWDLYKTVEFKTAKAAEEVESKTLNWIRIQKKLGVHLPKEFMPQGGWTETVDASEIDLSTIWAKVEEFCRKV